MRWLATQSRAIGQISPVEALTTITSIAAQVCLLGTRKGRIAAGFDADLLIIDGDPIADPDAIHRIRTVFHSGRPIPHPTS